MARGDLPEDEAEGVDSLSQPARRQHPSIYWPACHPSRPPLGPMLVELSAPGDRNAGELADSGPF